MTGLRPDNLRKKSGASTRIPPGRSQTLESYASGPFLLSSLHTAINARQSQPETGAAPNPTRGHPPFATGPMPWLNIAFRPPGQANSALIGCKISISFQFSSSASAPKFSQIFLPNCLRHRLASRGHGAVCADIGRRQVGWPTLGAECRFTIAFQT